MQNFSNSIWAMSKLRYECPRLVKALSERAAELMGTGTSDAIANLAWGLANLGYFDERVFQQIAKHAKIVKNGEAPTLTMTLWGFWISGLIAKNERGVMLLWVVIMSRPVWELQSENWRQLEIVRLFAKSEGIHLEVTEDGSEEIRKELMEKASMSVIQGSSQFEIEVAKDLEAFRFKGFEREVSPFSDGEGGNLLKIDIAWGNEMVGLELDGPTHFLKPIKGTEDTELPRDGPTKAKKRLLEALGWKVLRMSHWKKIEYDKLEDEEKMGIWANELGKSGVAPQL